MTRTAMRQPSPRRPKTARCHHCKEKITVKRKGPVPHYCGHSCRQLAYETRRQLGPKVMAARHVASLTIRYVIRDEIWKALQHLGLADPGPPPPKMKRPRPDLRLIEKEKE